MAAYESLICPGYKKRNPAAPGFFLSFTYIAIQF